MKRRLESGSGDSEDGSKDEKRLDTEVDVLRGRIRDSDDLKVFGSVFDTKTLMNLYSLASKGIIDALGGPISTGKEANIFSALKGDRHLAIKIYRISTSNFKAMQDYLAGDPRFGKVRGNKKGIVNAWTRKEYRNLLRAEEAGIMVPHPIHMVENILVMDMVGDGENPAPQLKDVTLDPDEAARVLSRIMDYMSILYHKAGLVHADLSEFNILYDGDPVIIDMGQSVTLDHPMARKFLARDILNVVRYFNKKYGIGSEEEIWQRLRADMPAKATEAYGSEPEAPGKSASGKSVGSERDGSVPGDSAPVESYSGESQQGKSVSGESKSESVGSEPCGLEIDEPSSGGSETGVEASEAEEELETEDRHAGRQGPEKSSTKSLKIGG